MKNLFGIDLEEETSACYENCKIIAAGPLTKQPGTIKYRWVLLEWDNRPGFSLHRESHYEKISFSSGTYFEKDQLAEAVKQFGEKMVCESEYMDSVYRDE